MMKNFFSENLSSMTFVFSSIVLLNALLSFSQSVPWENASLSILKMAGLVLVLFFLGYVGSYLPFHSASAYHIFNITIQLIAGFALASLLGMFSINVENLIVNGFVYILLYYLTYRIRKHRFNQLAQAINEHLGKRE
ncbi:hypothetical protein [Atopococcus tabaci]|uniref:hypothetical protein n=1 Tax=Atopococcus tabaci TaxID=269774 RepID=UPI0003F5EF1E|nr:hypothetical protein [Atopococcus tabaci]